MLASTREHALQIRRGDADAGIADGDVRDLAAIADGDGDAARRRVFDRIGDEIDQDLAQPLLVRLDLVGQPRVDFQRQRQPLGRRLHPEHVDDLLEQPADIDQVGADRQHAAFDPRDLEQPLDEVGDMLGRAADDRARLGAGEAGIALEQLRIAVDHVQRRTDLVADRDDIARLRLVRRLGAVELGDQRRIGGIGGGHDPPGRARPSI
jgi:hypothetical protein